MTLLSAKSLTKSFGNHTVLDHLSFELKPHSSLAITGGSGEGKTTLLHILGALDSFDEGELNILGKDVRKNPLDIRRNHVGFIFQSYQLFHDFSVLENLLMPVLITKKLSYFDAVKKAENLLELVSLSEKKEQKAGLLSGGEKQRAAIARAFMNDPELILADEPTGNLDRDLSKQIHHLLLNSVKELKKSLIVVTHDLELADLCEEKRLLQGGYLR